MADALSRRKMSSDWPILTKLGCELQRGCHTQVTCLATLRKVEGRSTFLATRNATTAVAKWGVTRELFLATCNAIFVAMRVARKTASCNMAFKQLRFIRCQKIENKFMWVTSHHDTLEVVDIKKPNSHDWYNVFLFRFESKA